ncbi:MAG: hypothetical protein QXR97_07185 [Thermoproteota archaeon]
MKSSEKGLSQFYKPDGLAKILLEEAERIEAERRAEAERLRAIMAHRMWLYEQAVNRARGELEEYRRLLESSRNLISSRDIKVNEMLIMELQSRLMSDPNGVEEDARGFRRLLESNVERIKKKRMLNRKKSEATLCLLEHLGRLNSALKIVDELCDKWASASRGNPEAEELYVLLLRSLGYNVNSLSDARDALKKGLKEAAKKRLREELEDNPWQRFFLDFFTQIKGN